MKNKILWAIVCLCLLCGCRKNEVWETAETFTPKKQTLAKNDAPIQLGQQEPSPYALNNINEACDLLGIPTKNATHIYVRFTPKNAAQYAALQERDDLELWEFPMDHEIIREGYLYLENETRPDAIQPLYAVVPLGHDLEGTPHTVLEELYFPDEGEAVLEDKAYELRGKDPATWDNIGTTAKAGSGIKPKGYLRVLDQWLGHLPVVHIKVRAKKGLKTCTVLTDPSGFFQMDKKFRGEVQFFTVCDNAEGNIRYLTGSNFLSLLQTYRGTLGTFGQTFYENFDYTLSPQHTNGVTATMMNNMYRTRQYCHSLGVGYHNLKLRYWAHNGSFLNAAGGSAPMLKHMYTLPVSALAGGLAGTALGTLLGLPGMPGVGFGGATAAGLVPLLTLYLELVKPDIYIPFETHGSINISNFNATLFHEHGHAIHFKKAGGQTFWYPFVLAIVNNYLSDPQAADFYGDYGDTEYGRVALSEAWAEFIGCRFALEMYGYKRLWPTPDPFGNPLPFFQEKNERTTPNIMTSTDDDWIPYGVFHDLIDLKNTGPYSNLHANEDLLNTDYLGGYGGTINPNGNALANFYLTLDYDVISPTSYKQRFFQNYITPSDAAAYNDLWNWYGY